MRILRSFLVPLALAVLLSIAGLAVSTVRSAAGDPSAAPSDSPSPGPISRTELAADYSAIASGYRLVLARTVIPPGGRIPAHRQPGDQVIYVENGMLNVDFLPDPMLAPDPDAESPGTLILVAGQSTSFREDTLRVWSNRGAVPVVVLTASLLDEFADPVILATPSAGPTPGVVRRIVVTGEREDAHRVVILDRSGHVRGARLPRPAELRFSTGGLSVDMDDGSRPRGRLALLQWSGTACGPVVDIDIAADLTRINIVDRSPGCDASSQGHALILELDDDADLSGTRVTSQRVRP